MSFADRGWDSFAREAFRVVVIFAVAVAIFFLVNVVARLLGILPWRPRRRRRRRQHWRQGRRHDDARDQDQDQDQEALVSLLRYEPTSAHDLAALDAPSDDDSDSKRFTLEHV